MPRTKLPSLPLHIQAAAQLRLLEEEKIESKERIKKAVKVSGLLDFIQKTNPRYKPSWFHEAICSICDRVIRGEFRRLILCMPPRHGKTEIVSRRLPAYLVGLNPDAQIIATSYSAALAARNNRDVQRVIDCSEYRSIFPNSQLSGKNIKTTALGSYLRNSEMFEIVGHSGSYRAAGVGGGITGMGFGGEMTRDVYGNPVVGGVGIIDDFFKNRSEAESPTVRNGLWEWYTSTFRTRCEDNSPIIVIATQWHSDGLIGRLIKSAKHDETADQWTVIKFPAIATPNKTEFDGRDDGQALWEEKYPLKELEKIQSSIGSYDWAALYQQNPTPREGGMIKYEWVKRYSERPAKFKMIVQSWDTASKAKELNCPWSCTTWGVTDEDLYYLLDVHTKRHEYPDGKHQVIVLADKWKPDSILIEDKSTGQSLLQELWGCGYSLVGIQPEMDKVTRMSVESATFESGRIYLPDRARWLADYESVLFNFPGSSINDPIDSTSQFLKWIKNSAVLTAARRLALLS